ncbi:two-component hybrid sensor and regulator [Bosea sp. BIWAKO-01]|nr:two-component hybrid sensor and regulator [Bosea sp. BIWAKO-01]
MGDERYRILVEAVTDYAIYMLDPTGTISSWNRGAERFKGYTALEVLGTNFSRFYTDADRARGLPAFALGTAAREGRFESEGWRVRKDGTTFWASVVIDAIYGTDGEILGFAKITRDLSERREAEKALRRSEERFRLLVQGVTDYAIYMLDRDGIISNWNQGAERIKGYAPDEIIGQHFSRFYTAEDREKGEPQRALDTAMREGKFEKEGWRVRKDGTPFWASVVIDAIKDDGEVIGFAKVTRDMTERRRQEQALEETRQSLLQSQKTEAIGQLTGGVAHDFNNLLSAILGSLELIRKQASNEKIAALADNAIEGARRGISLTQRMLSFARRQDLSPTTVDLPKLVSGMSELLQRSLGPLVSIETRFPLTLDAARVDPHQLELALLNLTMNARDAMPGGGTIIIAARAEDISAGGRSNLAPGRYLCLSVSDVGEGMDAQTLARATEPFFTTKGVGKGTGLGLSMVHGMSEQSGGRFVLNSRFGEGTTAEIWLPAAGRLPEEASAEAPSPRSDDKPQRSLRVLAVDDDALILMNTAALLEDLGHSVIEAASAREALEVLDGGAKIDLVITDHAMPRMTGAQLAEIIRAKWPGLPIILATGYAELPSDETQKLPRLSKPFWQADLQRAVDAATS